ncbi:MAG: helix-turn-helix transcriptional regulator [Verrucomicrobiota bacterium]
MNPKQTSKATSVKPRNKSQRKLQGASFLSEHAWHQIGCALEITKRELQIVQGVFDNRHEPDIAKRLKISPHTVHMHMNRLFKKLSVKSRTELVLRIVEQLVTLTLSETAVLPPICPRHQSGDCLRYSPPTPPAKP